MSVGNLKQRVIVRVFRGGWIPDVPDARNFLAAFGSDGPLTRTGFDDAASASGWPRCIRRIRRHAQCLAARGRAAASSARTR